MKETLFEAAYSLPSSVLTMRALARSVLLPTSIIVISAVALQEGGTRHSSFFAYQSEGR